MAMRRRWSDLLNPSWKLLLAAVAVLDVLNCWSGCPRGLVRGSDSKRVHKHDPFYLHRGKEEQFDANDTCPVEASAEDYFYCYYSSTHPIWKYVSLLFCGLCVLESVRRAREARQIALETAALDNFEKKLAKLYQAARSNVFRQQPSLEDYAVDDMMLARNTIRVWTPVASILLCWFVLIPWTTTRNMHNMRCGDDPALATLWMEQSILQMQSLLEFVQEEATRLFWKVALPFSWFRPIFLIQRIRLLTRWVKYVRFAGPLLRLLLKLQDQLWVFTKTWRQTWQYHANKAKRLARRSMIWEDLQRIESLTKVQTALASLPSSLLHLVAQHGGNGERPTLGSALTSISSTDLDEAIAKKKKDSQRLKRRLDSLKNDLRQSSRIIPTSEIYERVVELTQELTRTVQTAFWNAHLISPHTRFSVGWRLVVTCALLSELFRLYWSWQLSGNFEIRYTDMTRRLLHECEQKSQPIRRWLGKLLARGHDKQRMMDSAWWYDTCASTSPWARFCLKMARTSEIAIDLVCFLDIFVWFFTGELDDFGVILPKHWFSRCILPGTLIQVLDHPTVPEKLPQLLSYSFKAVRAVGYSRVIRWGLALSPAVDMVVVAPLKAYLFRPMDEDEYFKYTESIALIPTFSSASIYHSASRTTNHTHGLASVSHPSHGDRLLRRSHPSSDMLLLNDMSIRSEGSTDSYRNLHGSLKDSINHGYGFYY